MPRETKHEGATDCRRKFLRFFPEGFHDAKYVAWERGYKWEAHERWEATLDRETYGKLLRDGKFAEVAARAVRIESKTNLLFSFEKMALRDASKSPAGARAFAEGLFEFIHGEGTAEQKFERCCETVGALPREHVFLKPNVTRTAARAYGFDFRYQSRPSWETYANLLEFAAVVRRDLRDLRPRDMIDIQSFIWVQGSSEYD
ncbi:MAG TPA: hypothetical protein VNA19_09430 [Pyrinomonadaceae bacterium]|nr:hypothetical protein [Pyrinomonadaceae bacterium]